MDSKLDLSLPLPLINLNLTILYLKNSRVPTYIT